jgi:hypothetical protein
MRLAPAKRRLLMMFLDAWNKRFQMPDGTLLPPGDLPRWEFSTPNIGGLAADKRLYELGTLEAICFEHYYHTNPAGKRTNTTIWRFVTLADKERAERLLKHSLEAT